MINLKNISTNGHCLVATNTKFNEMSLLWHKRLGHASIHQISKLIKKNLVKRIPNFNFENDYMCTTCQLGKLTRNTLKAKSLVSMSRPLELLHIDLFRLIRTTSLRRKKY